MKDLTEHIQKRPQLILVGNRLDVPKRVVTEDLAAEYAASIDALYFETSAKTGENVSVVFETAAESLVSMSSDPPPDWRIVEPTPCC
jgi:hypothetical protein